MRAAGDASGEGEAQISPATRLARREKSSSEGQRHVSFGTVGLGTGVRLDPVRSESRRTLVHFAEDDKLVSVTSFRQETDLIEEERYHRQVIVCLPACVVLLLGFLAMFGTMASILWVWPPVLVEGPFGYGLAVRQNRSIHAYHFERAQAQARRAWLDESGTGVGYVWRHIEVFYDYDASELTHAVLHTAHHVEASLRSLPRWRRFCDDWVHQRHKDLCRPGDSLMAIYFASQSSANFTFGQEKQMPNKIDFDGEGTSPVIERTMLLQWLRMAAPGNMERWRPSYNVSYSALRSTFSFFLPEYVAEAHWTAFVRDDIETTLLKAARDIIRRRLADKLDIENPDDPNLANMRIFYQGDGFPRDQDLSIVLELYWLRAFGALSLTFLITLLVTQRLVLSVVATCIAVAAATLAALATARRFGGGELERADWNGGELEVGVVAIFAGFSTAAACVEMAVSSANALEKTLVKWPWWMESFAHYLGEALVWQHERRLRPQTPDANQGRAHMHDDAGSVMSSCASASEGLLSTEAEDLDGSTASSVSSSGSKVRTKKMVDAAIRRMLLVTSPRLCEVDFLGEVRQRLLLLAAGAGGEEKLREAGEAILEGAADLSREKEGEARIPKLLLKLLGQDGADSLQPDGGEMVPTATAVGGTTTLDANTVRELVLERLQAYWGVYRFLLFAYEGLAPSAATGVVLCWVSWACVPVPLLAEFAWTAGVGLLIAVMFGLLLFPSAFHLGLVLAQEAEGADVVARLRKVLPGCILRLSPVECALRPLGLPIRPLGEGLLRALASSVGTGAPHLLALVSFVLFFSGAWGVNLWPEVQGHFAATMPELFNEGSSVPEGRFVTELFAQTTNTMEIIRSVPRRGEQCRVDAPDAAQCLWSYCNTNTLLGPAAEGSCHCYTQAGPGDGGTNCGAAARLWFRRGEVPAPFLERFWPWLQGEVGKDLGKGGPQAASAWNNSGSFVEMSDWTSGDSFLNVQVSGGLPDASGAVPRFEDACLQALCFCGEQICSLTSSDWTQHTAVNTGGRRLNASEPGLGLEPASTAAAAASAASAGAAGSGRREASALVVAPGGGRSLGAVGAEAWRRPRNGQLAATRFGGRALAASDLVEIHATWGFAWAKNKDIHGMIIPYKKGLYRPAFNPKFQLANPWAQRTIMAFCEGYAPDMRIQTVQCWAQDFRRWLAQRRLRYPLRQSLFYNELRQFLEYIGEKLPLGEDYNYFWPDERGAVGATYVSFQVARPSKENEASFDAAWHDFAVLRDHIGKLHGMTNATVIMPWRVDEWQSVGIQVIAYRMVWWILGAAAVSVLLITGSPGLAMAVVASLGMSILYVVVIVVRFMGANVGLLEVVGLCAFLSYLLPPLIGTATQYAYACPSADDVYGSGSPLADDFLRQRGGVLPPGGFDQPSTIALERFRRRSHSSTSLATRSFSHVSGTFEGKDDTFTKMAKAAKTFTGTSHPYLQPPVRIYVGAIRAERHARLSLALVRGGEAVISFMVALAGVQYILCVASELSGMNKVSAMAIGGAAAIFPLTFGLLPVLLLIGLGPSKVKMKELYEVIMELRRSGFGFFLDVTRKYAARAPDGQEKQQMQIIRIVSLSVRRWAACRILVHVCLATKQMVQKGISAAIYLLAGTPGDPLGAGDPLSVVAVKDLGFPVSLGLHYAVFHSKHFGFDAEDTGEEARSDFDHADCPRILRLELRGATLKPPFHLAEAVRVFAHVRG